MNEIITIVLAIAFIVLGIILIISPLLILSELKKLRADLKAFDSHRQFDAKKIENAVKSLAGAVEEG